MAPKVSSRRAMSWLFCWEAGPCWSSPGLESHRSHRHHCRYQHYHPCYHLTSREHNSHLFNDLGRRISENLGEARETSFLYLKISILVQRFNAVRLHDSLPATDCTDWWLYPILYLLLNSLQITCTEGQKIIITEHLYSTMEYEDSEVLG